jgi:hypothetical protein
MPVNVPHRHRKGLVGRLARLGFAPKLLLALGTYDRHAAIADVTAA